MSAPLIPSPLDFIGRRPFAFYPEIENAPVNEWILGGRTWSEIEVINAHTGHRIWIPCRYIGAVADSSAPMLVVGLTKKLEYKSGMVRPRIKRVIEMPVVKANTGKAIGQDQRPSGPARVIGIRLERGEEVRRTKALATIGMGLVLLALFITIISEWIRS